MTLASGVAGAFTDAFEPIPSTAARLEVQRSCEYAGKSRNCSPGRHWIARRVHLRFAVTEDTVNHVALEDEACRGISSRNPRPNAVAQGTDIDQDRC